MRRFKDRYGPLPPSQGEFYKEFFIVWDFLVCDFIGLPRGLLLPGEIKSSDFWLAKSLSPSAVLPLGDGSASGWSTGTSFTEQCILLFQGEMPNDSQTWGVWTMSRPLFSPWSYWLQSRHATRMRREFRHVKELARIQWQYQRWPGGHPLVPYPNLRKPSKHTKYIKSESKPTASLLRIQMQDKYSSPSLPNRFLPVSPFLCRNAKPVHANSLGGTIPRF